MESDSSPNRKRKLAVQAILDRNAEIIHALHALQRSRTDLDPSAVELSLAQEVKDNMLSLTLAHPPNALAGPAKRAKTFLCTVRHMGLLPVKQKNKPFAKKQLPHNAASMLAANRSASLGHQQTLSNAATRPAESNLKLPAALHHSASASRLVPLLGSASQAASNHPFEKQVPLMSQQVQPRPGITDVQKDNLQRTLRMISEIAPGKRPDEMLLRYVMSKAEPMEPHSIRMIVEAWHQQHEQQLLQHHRQQLLLQQHQLQLHQQQPQHQEQSQRPGSTATEITAASYDQQTHAQADSDEVKQQPPIDTEEHFDSFNLDSDFEQSSKDQSEDQLGAHTSSAEHSHDQVGGQQQQKAPSYQADGQQGASRLPAEGQQRAFSCQTEGQHAHSRQSAPQQGAPTHLQHQHPGGQAQQQQQQPKQGQGLWHPISLPQDPDANSNPLLQEGMPHWQRQMLRQAHAQQLALSQQSNGARSLAHVLQQVSANPVEPQAQSHAQTGESQQESFPAAQAKQLKAKQGANAQAGVMTGMHKGSSAESPRTVTHTRSPSLQRSGSTQRDESVGRNLQRDESAGQVSLDAGMPPEPTSADQGYQSQRLQAHQTHRWQGQRQQPQSSQGQLHESRDQQSRPLSSQGAQQGHLQSQQPQPQQSQDGLPSQQPISVNQATQLRHLSRLASISDDPPDQQDDAVQSELHAIQQQLLAKSRSRSTDADKQAKGQMPEALPASRLRAGAKDLLSQMHQQQAGSRPASPTSQDLADKADAMSMSQAAPGHAQHLSAWLQTQQQQQQQHSAWQRSSTQQAARHSDGRFQDDAAAGQQGSQVKPHGVTVGSGHVQAGLSPGGQLSWGQSGLQSAGSGQLQSRLSGQLQSGQLQSRLSGQQQSEQILSESSSLQSSGSGQMQSRQSSLQSLGLGQSELQSHGSGQLRSGLQSAGPGQLQPGQRQSGQLPEAVRQQVARLNALRAAERQMSEQKKAFANKQQQQQLPSQHTPASTTASQGYSPSIPSSMSQQLSGDIAVMKKTGMPQQMAHLTSLQRAQMLIRQHQIQAMQLPNRAGHLGTAPGASPDNITSHKLGDKPGGIGGDTFGGQSGSAPHESPASVPGIGSSDKPGGLSGDADQGPDRHTSSSTTAFMDAQRKLIALLSRNPIGSDWGQPNPGFVPSTSSPRPLQSLGTPNAAFSFPGPGSSPRLSQSQGQTHSQSASPALSPQQPQPLGAQMHPPAAVSRQMPSLRLDTALGRVQAAHPTHGNGFSRPGPSEPGPLVSAALAVDQPRSSETLLNDPSPQNYDSISSYEPNNQLSPAPGQSPSTTADPRAHPRASEAVPAGSTHAHGPGSTTPMDSVTSGLASQLKPRPEGSGDIAELQRQLQQMHSRQGRAGAAKPQKQRQSQSPAAQQGRSLTVSPSVSGKLSLSANQSASLSSSPSPGAVSRGPGMEGRSLKLDAKATSPFAQPKASPAHQNRSPSVGHDAFLGTQDRQSPAAQHNLPPAHASGQLVPSHMSNPSPAFQLTASSNNATAIPAGQRRASPAGSPRASPAAQRTQPPADRPIASQTAQPSFAALERPRASPAAQPRASPAPEHGPPLQTEPNMAGASTQHAGSRLISSLPSFMASHGQLERQLPDPSREALARSMGAPPPAMGAPPSALGTTHSQTVTNNMSESASLSGADHAQQSNTSTSWPAYFASSSAAGSAPFSGASMASAMRARSGSPAIRAGASSAALKAGSSSPVVRHVSDSPGLKAHPSNFAGAAPSGPGNRARSPSPAVRAVSGSPDFTRQALGHQPAAIQPHSFSLASGPGPGDQPQPVPDPADDQTEL